ncbi:MAG: desulfoferrodoxin family protein [Bacillota bacterium]
MCDQEFLICKHCGNIVGVIRSSGQPISCCGEEMSRLEANTVDASKEKHVPVVSIDGDTVTVKVGSVPHPMIPEHHIEWIYLQTEHGGQRKCLAVDDAPEASFKLKDDKLIAVFEYCNLHGLWKTVL